MKIIVNYFQSAVSKGLKANEWIQSITSIMNGKGGGKPESAQASGSNISGLNEAAKVAKEYAFSKLDMKPAGN